MPELLRNPTHELACTCLAPIPTHWSTKRASVVQELLFVADNGSRWYFVCNGTMTREDGLCDSCRKSAQCVSWRRDRLEGRTPVSSESYSLDPFPDVQRRSAVIQYEGPERRQRRSTK